MSKRAGKTRARAEDAIEPIREMSKPRYSSTMAATATTNRWTNAIIMDWKHENILKHFDSDFEFENSKNKLVV